jgi:hypothetical protein
VFIPEFIYHAPKDGATFHVERCQWMSCGNSLQFMSTIDIYDATLSATKTSLGNCVSTFWPGRPDEFVKNGAKM